MTHNLYLLFAIYVSACMRHLAFDFGLYHGTGA